MNHEATTERLREHVWVARCACGHEAEGPNPGAAEQRHLVHVHIQNARAALTDAKENGGA